MNATCIAGDAGSTEISAALVWPALTATAEGEAFPPAKVTRKLAFARFTFGTPEMFVLVTGPFNGCAYTV
jgi:hypothetical protein